jgi:hypothetical protein
MTGTGNSRFKRIAKWKAVLFPALGMFQMPFLRAQEIKYFKEDDPMSALILGIGAATIVVIATIVNIIKHGFKPIALRPGGAKNSSGFTMPRQFSGFTLRSIAKNYDLTKEQTKMLEYIFAKNGVSKPREVLADPVITDKHFRRVYQSMVSKSGYGIEDSVIQKELSRLFSTRNAIEASPESLHNASAPEIGYGTKVVLSVNDKTYPLKIDMIRGEVIMVICPLNPLGEPLKFQKGARADLNYFDDMNHGFLQACRILDVVSAPRRPPILQLLTEGRPKILFKRKNRRRSINIACEFWVVTLTKTGSDSLSQTNMTVGNRKFFGEILNISPGGCSIRTRGLLKPGLRLKISLDYNKKTVVVLGQVLRINRGSSITSFVHIKFIKGSVKALNIINAVVYRYNDD